jgi:hypothetical protein
MMSPVPKSHPLRQLFTGLVEHTLYADVGLCDPEIADYLSELLVDFVHMDRIFSLRDARGRRIEEVADMAAEATLEPGVARADRDRLVHKHIGDFTLFWTGVYPEGLRRLRSPMRKDHLVDYLQQGKRSYAIASDLSTRESRPPGAVLRRLSDCFEFCVYGLGLVRKGWEQYRLARPDLPPLT